MRVRLAPAREKDAEGLTDLHLDVWEEAYAGLMPARIFAERRDGRAARAQRWRDIIGSGSSDTLLAWAPDNSLLGFSSTSAGRDADDDLPPLELMALYVRASAYGTGVGYALLASAIGASDAYLWVLDGNTRAIGFYERQGFRFDGSVKRQDVGTEHRMVRRAT